MASNGRFFIWKFRTPKPSTRPVVSSLDSNAEHQDTISRLNQQVATLIAEKDEERRKVIEKNIEIEGLATRLAEKSSEYEGVKGKLGKLKGSLGELQELKGSLGELQEWCEFAKGEKIQLLKQNKADRQKMVSSHEKEVARLLFEKRKTADIQFEKEAELRGVQDRLDGAQRMFMELREKTEADQKEMVRSHKEQYNYIKGQNLELLEMIEASQHKMSLVIQKRSVEGAAEKKAVAAQLVEKDREIGKLNERLREIQGRYEYVKEVFLRLGEKESSDESDEE